jgi:hypothetical protein
VETNGTANFLGREVPWECIGEEIHSRGEILGWWEDTVRGSGNIGFAASDQDRSEPKRFKVDMNLSLFENFVHDRPLWGATLDECVRKLCNLIEHDKVKSRKDWLRRPNTLDVTTTAEFAIGRWGKEIQSSLEQRGESIACRAIDPLD